MTAEIKYDVPADEYHALQRFSASGIKKLLVSAQDFYVQSWMNPKREEIESDTLNLGTAYHCRVLEGKTAFDKAYALKDKVDGRTKEGKLYNEQWAMMNPDAEPIKQEVHDQINNCKACQSRLFIEGKPEVTILWDDEETGVPMKARLDWMDTGVVTDLKTFSNSNGIDPLRLIAGHIGKYSYHIQAAVYREAYSRAHDTPHPDFNFVFQQTGAANNCIARAFPGDLLLASQGRDLMRRGINKFRDMFAKYGTSPWFDDYGMEVLTDESFPLYMLED